MLFKHQTFNISISFQRGSVTMSWTSRLLAVGISFHSHLEENGFITSGVAYSICSNAIWLLVLDNVHVAVGISFLFCSESWCWSWFEKQQYLHTALCIPYSEKYSTYTLHCVYRIPRSTDWNRVLWQKQLIKIFEKFTYSRSDGELVTITSTVRSVANSSSILSS